MSQKHTEEYYKGKRDAEMFLRKILKQTFDEILDVHAVDERECADEIYAIWRFVQEYSRSYDDEIS